MRNAHPISDLPVDLLALIGLLVIKHNYAEVMASNICYDLAGVDDVVGRLSFREGNLRDRLAMIEALSKLKAVNVDEDLLKDLLHDAEVSLRKRNSIVHGVFYKAPGGSYHLRETAGKWVPPGSDTSISRKLMPEGPVIDAEQLGMMCDALEAFIEALRTVRDSVSEQLQSQRERSA